MAGTRLAVLIDAENATFRVIGAVMAAAREHGRPCVVRAYGDWTGPSLGGWAAAVEAYSIRVVQQNRHAGHKNASDVALVIEAMDLLHSGLVDGFCIVSSDSDFTRLAQRIREQGLWLMVCGRRDTPRALMAACDRFVAFEELEPVRAAAPPAAKPSVSRAESASSKAAKAVPPAAPVEIAELLLAEWEAARLGSSSSSCSVPLSTLGSRVHQSLPGFDPRAYGYRQFIHLVQATGLFELQTSGAGKGTLVGLRPGLMRRPPTVLAAMPTLPSEPNPAS